MKKMIRLTSGMIGLLMVFLDPVAVFAQNPKTFTVVVDAGHGGKDTGTTGDRRSKMTEKDVVLKIALKVDSILQNDKDIKVILTRKTDKFLELRQRANMANKAKADLFVSIHCNANPNPKARGSETYVLGVHRNKDNLEVAKKENAVIKLEKDYKIHYQGFNPDSPESFIGLEMMQEEFLEQSILLASMIQQEYEKRTKTHNRSVQQAGFAVLRLTYMPSVLTEVGFLSNPEEAKFLRSNEGQEKIAISIANAIKKYKNILKTESEFFSENNDPTTANNSNIQGEKDDEYNLNKTSDTTQPSNAYFSIQILTSSKKINPKSKYFKGLSPVEFKKFGRAYKYFYGKTTSFEQARKMQARARKAGFKGAFIVGFINGKKVPASQIKLK